MSDQTLAGAAFALMAVVSVVQLGRVLATALRLGRISGTARADQPAAYWSAMFGISLFIFLFSAGAAIALTS